MQQATAETSYLTQYKQDISTRQKLIRQRLGVEPTSRPANADDSRITTTSLDAIPPIDDDDDNNINNHGNTYQRNASLRSAFFNDDSEASLQFFKKNLGQNTDSNATKQSHRANTTTTSLYQRQLQNGELDTEPIPNSPRYQVSKNVDLDQQPSKAKPSVRPVPFKQTPSSSDQLRVDKYKIRDVQQSQPKDLSRTNNDIVSSNKTSNLNNNNYNDNYSSRPNSSYELKELSKPSMRSENASRNAPMSAQDTEATVAKQVPESHIRVESPYGPFSKRPLYNSLLRAHDSIRLKVNRPKVRPKTDEKVQDTEIDDELELEDPQTTEERGINERGIDIFRNSWRRSKSKSKKPKEESKEPQLPVRNFADVRRIVITRSEESERSLGVTVRVEDGNIVVARILAGSLADKQGALQVDDIILAVNQREVYTPEQLQEALRATIRDDSVSMDIVPSYREELPTLCLYLRALFTYDANEDTLLPCKEVGVSFNQGDILEVVNQEDPNWWQARRVDSENLQTGLIPSQELEERRRAFVSPDYDLATRTSICGTRVSRKSKKKEIYNVGLNNDFDKAELQLYEEVCRTPAFERRTLVLIGANGVGKQALKARLVTMDPDRFGTPLAHTSRLPRDGEEDKVHYHFVTRERMEEDIIEGRYLEYGEYDGALYGTKLDSVREIIGAGKVCVLDCSPTCLKILKSPDYLPFVAFIAAPTLEHMRYTNDWARGGMKTYSTFDRALSRQSRRAKTLQDFAYDFFEDEEPEIMIEESARLFRMYENYFDIVLVNDNYDRTYNQLREVMDQLSMAPQWIPISWIYGS